MGFFLSIGHPIAVIDAMRSCQLSRVWLSCL